MLTPKHLIQPVPRRIRGYVGGTLVFDTTQALYFWEWAHYPQYYIPIADVNTSLLVSEGPARDAALGVYESHGLSVAGHTHPAAAKLYTNESFAGLAGMVRFEWDALDAWFEEDEQVFVHPRSPYARVDAVRSTRTVRIELDGAVLAESSSPVMLYETGLPTRYYLNRTDVNFDYLEHNDTVSACPYKGTTGDYWSVRVGDKLYPDLAWSYTFPTRQLLPITGLVAFYSEKVDTFLDGEELPRSVTHFFPATPSEGE